MTNGSDSAGTRSEQVPLTRLDLADLRHSTARAQDLALATSKLLRPMILTPEGAGDVVGLRATAAVVDALRCELANHLQMLWELYPEEEGEG